MDDSSSPFGQVIFTYTRAQAVADRSQVDVTSVARKAGIRFPVFFARTVFDAYITAPDGIGAPDEAARLWDVLSTLRFVIRRAAAQGLIRIPFTLYIRNENHCRKPVKLAAICGALDVNDTQTAITVIANDEDIYGAISR